MKSQKTFRSLQTKWYKKLEKEGFEDIENTKHDSRPLNEWHSFKKPKPSQSVDSLYQSQIETFLNQKDFDDICRLMTKHGNSRLTVKQIRNIWELHIDGLSNRKIEKQLKIPRSTVYDYIKGLRLWMLLTL
jgi:predicted DNA-binding protein YlxM (UPF0122 family)